MEAIKLTKIILDAISDRLSKLSKSELNSIVNGSSEIEISIVKKEIKNKTVKSNDRNISSKADMLDLIVSRLGEVTSREAGIIILEEIIPLKNDLESFAKYIDVVVNKSDRVENVKSKIVDATVGAKLRSGAIQGKEVELFMTSPNKKASGECDLNYAKSKAD